MKTVTVIGSINLDRTIRVKNMPKPGETIHTKEIFQLAVVRVRTKRSQLNGLVRPRTSLAQSVTMMLVRLC